jgi:hypothetical protein
LLMDRILLALLALGLVGCASTERSGPSAGGNSQAEMTTPSTPTGSSDTGGGDGVDADTGPTAAPAFVEWEDWSSLPACDSVQRDESGTLPDCRVPLNWPPGCDSNVPSVVNQGGLIYAGPGIVYGFPAVFVVENEETWAEVLERSPGMDLDVPVDFQYERVVVAGYSQSSTCGISAPEHGVEESAGEGYYPKVWVRFEDTSGGCPAVCEAAGAEAVVYTVPRSEGYPSVCVELLNTCH